MVLREECDIQSKNTLISFIYVCPWTVTIFKLFIAAAEIADAVGPFSMKPFPRIVSAELNPLMV